jgi:hypothetical protein
MGRAFSMLEFYNKQELITSMTRTSFMVRKSFFAVTAVLLVASAANAGIILTQTKTATLNDGLSQWTVSAVSDDAANQTINGIDTPSVVAGLGGGLPHQVWLNNSGAFTSPTKGDQTPGLWNAAYTPYDSFWLFDAANSLSVGAAFTEANNFTGGTSGLPAGALGAPATGFGAMGTAGGGSGAKLFTLASGLQGTTVALGQFVIKDGTTALLNGTILTAQGNNATIQGFAVGAVPEPATLGLIGLALAGGLGFIRRR